MTELLGVDERPDHPIVDPQAPVGQLAHQPPQREVALPTALQQPLAIRADQLLRPPATPRQRRHPPRLPVLRTQSIAVLIPTPKRPAAARRDIPSRSTAFTTRSRRSLEYDLPIHAGLLSSQHLESENIPSRESPTTQNQLIPL